MKKTTIFLISALCTLTILFSSCLGDTNSSMSPDRSISYVISKDGQQYALTAEQIYITNDFVQKTLDAQKFYHLKYSWNTDDTKNSAGAYQLKNITYSSGDTYPIQEISTFDIKNKTDYEIAGKNDFLGLTNFVPYYFSAINLLNDKWVFQCTVSAYKEDFAIGRDGANNIRLNIVLQPNSQNSLEKNQAVSDVYLERINDLAIDTSKQKVTDSFLVVVDLRNLRSYFDDRLYQESVTDKSVLAYNQFKYYKYVTVNSGSNYFEDKLTSVGALSGDSNIYPLQIGGK